MGGGSKIVCTLKIKVCSLNDKCVYQVLTLLTGIKIIDEITVKNET
jgi:hypothetical protein